MLAIESDLYFCRYWKFATANCLEKHLITLEIVQFISQPSVDTVKIEVLWKRVVLGWCGGNILITVHLNASVVVKSNCSNFVYTHNVEKRIFPHLFYISKRVCVTHAEPTVTLKPTKLSLTFSFVHSADTHYRIIFGSLLVSVPCNVRIILVASQ